MLLQPTSHADPPSFVEQRSRFALLLPAGGHSHEEVAGDRAADSHPPVVYSLNFPTDFLAHIADVNSTTVEFAMLIHCERARSIPTPSMISRLKSSPAVQAGGQRAQHEGAGLAAPCLHGPVRCGIGMAATPKSSPRYGACPFWWCVNSKSLC